MASFIGLNNLRWQPSEAEIKAGRTTLSAVYAAALNHEVAFNCLKSQATLGEVLSIATLSFAYTKKEISHDTKLIQGVNLDSKDYINEQGEGLCFRRLMDAKAEILSPLEWLSLLSRSSNLKDYHTYPTPYSIDRIYNWEWLGGINTLRSARTDSSKDGANFGWDIPLRSADDTRARSVFRGIPGVSLL